MTTDTWIVFLILFGTLILFLTPFVRLDVTSLTMLLALLLCKIITPTEALEGFSQPVVLMIAGLFIVGGALLQTGVAHKLGSGLIKIAGHKESSLIILLMGSTAFLSAFMSSTGTMAVFLPITVSLGKQAKISPSRLLIPISFASLLGGMLTLIGTPPNMIVSNQLKQAGLAPIGFFALTPIGLGILGLAIAYMLTLGRYLLPSVEVEEDENTLSPNELLDSYQVSEDLYQLKITSFSPLCNKSIAELKLPETHQVGILSMSEKALPEPEHLCLVTPSTVFLPEHIIVVEGTNPKDIQRFALDMHLEFLPLQQNSALLKARESYVSEVVIRPRSRMIGKSIRTMSFRERYHVTVLSLKRYGQKVTDIPNTPLRFADMLLVQGAKKDLNILAQSQRDFVLLNPPISHGQPSQFKMSLVIAIVVFMLSLMTFEILAPVTAVLFGAVLLLLSRCITMEDAYRSINWESILLIACMMPMATALDKTGGVKLISETLVYYLGSYGPFFVMAGLFFLTSGFSLFISNTATTVLMSPIALTIAKTINVSPYPLLIVVAIAASAAFSTPVATPVNTMVVGPGKYKFSDFIKVGLPLQFLVMVVALALIPYFFPL